MTKEVSPLRDLLGPRGPSRLEPHAATLRLIAWTLRMKLYLVNFNGSPQTPMWALIHGTVDL